MNQERGGAKRCRAGIRQRSERVVTVVVAVTVLPLVAHRRHGVDDVKHQVSVLVSVQSQHDHVVIDRIPIRHVNGPVAVKRGVNRFVGGDVSEHDRHPRSRLVRMVEFKGVHRQLLRCGVAGQQEQMVLHMDKVPRPVGGRSGSLSERGPHTRFVQSQDRRDGVSTDGQHRVVASKKVQTVFVGGAAGLWYRVFLPFAASGP